MKRQEFAETMALHALTFVIARDDLAPLYLAAGGIGAEELRARAGEPEVLASVLDFLLGEDAWVLAFAAEAGIRPEEVAAARRALPGGDMPHWT